MSETEKRPPVLCPPDQCTACMACEQTCPTAAISMQMNERGYNLPHIDPSKCINCNACERVCPIINERVVPQEKPTVLACWHKDDNVRMVSSSGGAFSALAAITLSHGGYVWGAAYNEDMQVVYTYTDTEEVLNKLRRSKYVQCHVGDAFKKIKAQLTEGKEVLFCGTSCHVRGLLSFIPKTLKSGLTTVDFICHGVPAPGVFKTYIDWIERRYNDKVNEFNFRDKTYGVDNGVMSSAILKNKGKIKLIDKENSYMYGMLHNTFLRPCCLDCKSNGFLRESDFTIADFWGLGRKIPFTAENPREKGISLMALNSVKAKELYKNKLLHINLNIEERTLQEALEGNGPYVKSAKAAANSETFWKEYQTAKSWDDVLHFFKPTLSEQAKQFVKVHFGPIIADKLRKLLGR